LKILYQVSSTLKNARSAALPSVGTGDPLPEGAWRLPALSGCLSAGQNPLCPLFGQKNVAKIYLSSPA